MTAKPYILEVNRPATPPADWADALAIDICADVMGRRHTEAASLVAARLRTVKSEGECEGLALASRAFRGVNWS